MPDQSFGARLRALRQAAGLTMEQLAEASGVSARAISDMERGHSRAPQARTRAALAAALGAGADALAGDVPARTDGRPRTHDLPRAITDFVGRNDEIRRVRAHAATDGTGPAPVVVVHGQGGLGKTALALRAAGELAEAYPDGRFHVDLRGAESGPLPPGEALMRLLRALDVAPRRIAGDDDERAGQLRDALRDRRCLLVLDDAADEAQVRPLLPGDGRSLTLITSRRALAGLEGVLRLPLAPLAPHESAALLARIAGQAADPASAADVGTVAGLCGHLPLALRIAGTRLASRPAWTVGHLVARLADEDRRLAALTAGDTSVEAAFALSHAQVSHAGRALFRRLGHVPGPDFGLPIAALLTGDPGPDRDSGSGHALDRDSGPGRGPGRDAGPGGGTGRNADHDGGTERGDDLLNALDELEELGLLEPAGPDRYRFHDLIRLFARDRLRREESAGARAATEQAMSRRILETAIVAGRWFEPGYGAPPDGWTGLVPLPSQDDAAAWLQLEAENWLGALRVLAAAGDDQLVVDTAEAMHWYSDRTHYWTGWYEVFGLSRAAAARLPDRRQEVTHLNYLAWAAATCVHRTDEGARLAMEAHDVAVTLGDLREQAWALQYAAESWRRAGAPERSLDAVRRAVPLADAAGDHDSYVQLFQRIGVVLIDLGRYDEALESFRTTLRELGRRPVAPEPALGARTGAHTFAALALARAGRWPDALREAERALPLATEFGGNSLLSLAHLVRGRARNALGADGRDDLIRALEHMEISGYHKYEAEARAELSA
ncbi:transcriptional regulator with XRE-family HTH domain/tetratricopeptide (TPR) repeat protein [Catenuloplanes nepalensis]|uniref:Transcriptional regulator with XRE-family HTH domain/tetratricopeptide (TPR) repeat protein n=1 Tax=Catenuloplanes nepalensis TaxID=587533 RepID=A0ABT9MSD0_9ACTN|nr:helix-turn-helix domain-containing protein [Catenuloplanes nepalensis]MDP9794284.1 transcriptional regulator with XRE-family HTH domain/tetratricopeptide (TPR) repeat protein [Catenuloplanes nepalensis]